MKFGEYTTRGVRVDTDFSARPGRRRQLLFVHGGCHASWCWAHFLPFFAEAGWDCHALNWYGHGGSDPLPTDRFIQRGIADIAEEIGHIADRFERPPILIGHSMGGLAVQKYAELHAVTALVLITPVVPAEVGGAVIELPVDMDKPWGPPPLDVACELFFQGLTRSEAQTYHGLLCPESPRAVFEATRWTVPIDRSRLTSPILILSGEHDKLTPASTGAALAEFYRADYRRLARRGHNLLLEPGWQESASIVAEWLTASIG